VLHGTATLEETAYFLHLTAKTSKPIVLVGAIRPPSGMSSDADLNLLNAVRVASSKESVAKGVLVVLHDAIHSAREVTKGSTLRLDAFVSRDTGPLGYVDGFGTVAYSRLPAKPHTLNSPFTLPAGTLPRVDIAVSYAGSDGAAIDAFVKAGALGIVLACTAFDGRTEAEDVAIGNAIAQGTVVVFSSRVGSGRVVLSPALRGLGLVGANDLLPWKARILLMLALAETTDYRIVQGYFDQF
jgi:L-asparaginase